MERRERKIGASFRCIINVAVWQRSLLTSTHTRNLLVRPNTKCTKTEHTRKQIYAIDQAKWPTMATRVQFKVCTHSVYICHSSRAATASAFTREKEYLKFNVYSVLHVFSSRRRWRRSRCSAAKWPFFKVVSRTFHWRAPVDCHAHRSSGRDGKEGVVFGFEISSIFGS